jgi:hypothetical protein
MRVLIAVVAQHEAKLSDVDKILQEQVCSSNRSIGTSILGTLFTGSACFLETLFLEV